jgi:hypothetical protein
MRLLFDLTGKTAELIGGNSTLGSVMVEALGAHGAQVARLLDALDHELALPKTIVYSINLTQHHFPFDEHKTHLLGHCLLSN